MATTQVQDLDVTESIGELTPTQWGRQLTKEYIEENPYSPFMGSGGSAVIKTMNPGVEPGQGFWAPLVKFSGEGTWVENDAVLSGNEDEVETFGHYMSVSLRRTANAVSAYHRKKSVVDLLEVSREDLKRKASIKLRNEIRTALTSIGVYRAPVAADEKGYSSPKPYAAATAAERNAWQTANNDRILFGHSEAKLVAGNHASSLANVAATDVLTLDLIRKLRRKAALTQIPSNTRWAISPTGAKGYHEETYVFFVNMWAMRDLRKDPEFQSAFRDGWDRGIKNPLFKPGDLYYHGVIIREVNDFPILAGAGASGVNVGHCVFAGAQAVAAPWGASATPIKEMRDYEHITGIGIKETRGMGKMFKQAIQTGAIDVFLASQADS